MSRSPSNRSGAKSGSFALTIKVPCSARSARSARSGYVAVCAVQPVHEVSDAEVDLFDAIFNERRKRPSTFCAENDNPALGGGSRQQAAERPQM
jgi:hypothetical protein